MVVMTPFFDIVAGVAILAGRSSLLDTKVFKTGGSNFTLRHLLGLGFVGYGGWHLWKVERAQDKLKKSLEAESCDDLCTQCEWCDTCIDGVCENVEEEWGREWADFDHLCRRCHDKHIEDLGMIGESFGAEPSYRGSGDLYDCGCAVDDYEDDWNISCESCGYVSCLDCHYVDSTDVNPQNWKCYEGYGCNKGAESFNAPTHYTYWYTLNEEGMGDDYDTFEEAEAAVASSETPMEIYERRVNRLALNPQQDIRVGAESFGAELERGEAAMRIVLADGELLIYHDSNNELLFRRPIYEGEWDKLWAHLRGATFNFGAEEISYPTETMLDEECGLCGDELLLVDTGLGERYKACLGESCGYILPMSAESFGGESFAAWSGRGYNPVKYEITNLDNGETMTINLDRNPYVGERNTYLRVQNLETGETDEAVVLHNTDVPRDRRGIPYYKEGSKKHDDWLKGIVWKVGFEDDDGPMSDWDAESFEAEKNVECPRCNKMITHLDAELKHFCPECENQIGSDDPYAEGLWMDEEGEDYVIEELIRQEKEIIDGKRVRNAESFGAEGIREREYTAKGDYKELKGVSAEGYYFTIVNSGRDSPYARLHDSRSWNKNKNERKLPLKRESHDMWLARCESSGSWTRFPDNWCMDCASNLDSCYCDEDYYAESFGAESLQARQKRGALEKEIAEENDWVIEVCKANIWEGDGSIKCPNCKDNLNADWHIGSWKSGSYYNWERLSDTQKEAALIRFPRGIACFQCGEVIQMYRNDNAVRGEDGLWTLPKSSKAESFAADRECEDCGISGLMRDTIYCDDCWGKATSLVGQR